MSVGNTSIEWTDATWNPVRGCTKVSPGCALGESAFSVPAGVMSAYKLPRPTLFVVAAERDAAATRAGDRRVVLAWLSTAIRKARAVLHGMVCARRHNLNVRWSIVGLDPVDVMRDFAWTQGPTELLLGYKPVLVDVSTHVSEMVARLLDEHIAVGRDAASTLPVRISRAGMNDAHVVRVTRIVGLNPYVS